MLYCSEASHSLSVCSWFLLLRQQTQIPLSHSLIYCSIAGKRHLNSGSLWKKAFHWELLYNFRWLVPHQQVGVWQQAGVLQEEELRATS